MNKYKNYIFFVLYVLLNPKLIWLLFRKINLPTYIQYQWLKNYKIGTVIDIGGYRGSVSRVLHDMFPESMFFIFDPVKENCTYMKKLLPYQNVTIRNSALSNKTGEYNFYKNKFLPASSFLRVKENIKDYAGYRRLDNTERIIVNTTTLDDYFKNKKLRPKILLKIDVQGTEDLVLKGGKNILNDISIIYIETAFNGVYENESVFYEIYELLTKSGFKYKGEIPESEFYPVYSLKPYSNAVFIKE